VSLLRNRRAVLDAVARIALAHGRTRVGARIGTVLLDRGRRCRRWRGALLGAARRRAMVAPRRIAVVVGERGRREGGEAQHREENCGSRASRHELRDCARMVAMA
jgi:hypothetical protein